MIRNAGPGKFIVLEGLDGSGTTTQTRLLAESLRKKNIRHVWTTREPSDGPVGSQIRGVLTRQVKLQRIALAGMFVADRLDHLYSHDGVIDRLRRGEWVIMDRYYYSSFAYQALDMAHDEKAWLMALHQPCLQPDITIFVDVSIETSMTRITVNRGFHFELFEEEDKLKHIREQYFKAIDGLRRTGEVIHVISGEQTVESVQKNIWQRVDSRLLDKAFLSLESEQRVWAYGSLKRIRQEVESSLNLAYLGSTYTPPSVDPKNPSQGNAGGYYKLIFLDETAIEYKIVAWLNAQRVRITKIQPQTKASGREKYDEIERICKLVFKSHDNQLQLDFKQ